MTMSNFLSRFPRRAFLKKIVMMLGFCSFDLHNSVAQVPLKPGITKLKSPQYFQVRLCGGLPQQQFQSSIETLLTISDDSLLKPFRQLTKNPLAAQGLDLKGWYAFNPQYDWRGGSPDGFAPGHAFGQWLSAMSRAYASTKDERLKKKIDSLVAGFDQTIKSSFFEDARFPAYTFDKLVSGLMDAYKYAGCKNAASVLDRTTDAVLPCLPKTAVDRLVEVPGRDASYTWDESYTLPENLFLAYENGLGQRYLDLAKRFMLDETFFDPLSKGENVLLGKHAYSYMNALSSAAQAYRTLGEEKYLKAALNAFQMIQEGQSYATGGWGPDELFQNPQTDFLADSLRKSHHSFETPCGAYAHLKLMSHLTCVTGESRFGDSAEKVFYNTVLGARPLQSDGHAFYYADYNNDGSKTFSEHIFPCCAGTLPQGASDYAKHAYFVDDRGVYVNLYINSELSFEHEGKQVRLQQSHHYPQKDVVTMHLALTEKSEFSLRLRIPHWCDAEKVAVTVNGNVLEAPVVAGAFLTLHKEWEDGDVIAVVIPQTLRLQPIDARHPNIVALTLGARVLFALGEVIQPVTKNELLSSTCANGVEHWFCTTANGGEITFAPYTSISDEKYTTYLTTT